jgi:4-aminobutyrate aminotransferase-like enzyme
VKGLLVGIEIEDGTTAKQVRDKLLRRGIITGSSLNPQVLRILAPLILEKNDVDLFIRVLEELSLSGGQ